MTHCHERRLHLVVVVGGASKRQLDTGTHVAVLTEDALATRQTADGVDIHTLLGYDMCGGAYVLCRQRPPDDGENVAVLALLIDPFLILVVGESKSVLPE